MQLSAWLDDGTALLALPLGAYRLEGLNVARVERNALGTVRVEQGPESLTFSVRVDPEARTDAAPDAADLKIAPAVAARAREGEPGDRSRERRPARAARAIEDFFRSRFAYSLDLDSRQGAAAA